MASRTSGTILFSFAAVFSCLELLEAATKVHASRSRFAWPMAAAFVLAASAFVLTLLLLVSHVRALGTADAAGGRFVGRLAKATLLAATAALLAGAVTFLVASGYLGGAVDGVGRVRKEN